MTDEIAAVFAKAKLSVCKTLKRRVNGPVPGCPPRLQTLLHGLPLQSVHPAQPPNGLLIQLNHLPCVRRLRRLRAQRRALVLQSRAVAGLQFCVAWLFHAPLSHPGYEERKRGGAGHLLPFLQ